jgi:hypothetical protein
MLLSLICALASLAVLFVNLRFFADSQKISQVFRASSYVLAVAAYAICLPLLSKFMQILGPILFIIVYTIVIMWAYRLKLRELACCEQRVYVDISKNVLGLILLIVFTPLFVHLG